MNIAGSVALVTGANRGLGKAYVDALLSPGAVDVMRKEMEVNVFGMASMIQGFAPILAKNGGGAIVNMLSVVSWFTPPFNATYAASKHAALAVSDAARIELHKQGTQVIGVYAGFIDTEMAAAWNGPKTTPAQVAARALEGGINESSDPTGVRAASEIRRAVKSGGPSTGPCEKLKAS